MVKAKINFLDFEFLKRREQKPDCNTVPYHLRDWRELSPCHRKETERALPTFLKTLNTRQK